MKMVDNIGYNLLTLPITDKFTNNHTTLYEYTTACIDMKYFIDPMHFCSYHKIAIIYHTSIAQNINIQSQVINPTHT